MKPGLVGDVTSAKTSYHSVYGDIVSEWKKFDDKFELKVEIPANTTATVSIPANSNQSEIMNGAKARSKYKDARAIIKIGSGIYNFTTNQ